jgi:hypothetical protein
MCWFDNHARVQGNETSPMGRDPWEVLDVPVTTAGSMYLSIELVDTKQPVAPRSAAAAAAADSQSTVADTAGDGGEGSTNLQQAEVLARPPVRLKLRWNNTGNVDLVPDQADNTAEASSVIPHVNTPGMLHNYYITVT